MSEALRFDHIIVGAGTAGCLLANRLSADPTRRVLLLEAGGDDHYHWIHIPVGYLYCIGNPRTDWLYRTEPDAGLNGRSLRYPRGKVLGGCSSINGMIYMRGQARDYDGWAHATGDEAWRWEACLPYFMRHEHHHRAGDAAYAPFHASGGEWRVDKQRVRWDILDAFSLAAQEAGLPASEDFNRGDNHGVGYFEVNQRAGWRWNTSKAFLEPVARRPNLTVWTQAHAHRLLFDTTLGGGRPRAAGLRLRHRQTLLDVELAPGGELVLAAGSIGTAQLLQLSGVGPGDWLQGLGIPVVADRPAVGRHLQDHLQIRAVFSVQGTGTLNTLAATPLGKLRIALAYAWSRHGPMSMAPSQLGAFARSDPDRPWPNIEYHVQPLSLDAFGEPLHAYDAFTASVCNLNPTSRGEVRIQTPDPGRAPSITPNYLSTEQDRKVAADSLRMTRHIVSQPALQRYQPRELKPGASFQSDEELARLAGDIATTIFHPVGTCRMGPMVGDTLAQDAVVDSRLRVGGVQGLRIADASVMPSITSGNTNAPTLMIAERAAQWLLDSAR